MAAKSLVYVITLASISLIIMICDAVDAANVFTVGNEKGWTLGFDYQVWAQDKQFHVGDTLVFNYPKGVHNVLVVNEWAFENCVKEPLSGKFETGQDNVVIKESGDAWFICGVGLQCEYGMKLNITVTGQSSTAASPAPAPESSNWIGESEEHWSRPW